jgi:putative oxygen-independent coproporphyrinogen III oxidase
LMNFTSDTRCLGLRRLSMSDTIASELFGPFGSSLLMKPGVYVHIPFCEQRCYYCAFTVAVTPENTYSPYVDRLLREIDLSQYDEQPETIYFGGGTPSIIDGGLIEKIIRKFPQSAREISIEVNPGTLDDLKLERYRSAGVNRISLGVQSFDDDDLKTAGRLHSAADALRDVDALRRHGFDNVGFDLIAGLPHQRPDGWKRNLDCVEQLSPEHVSIYMLDVEERSAWGRDRSEVQADDVFAAFYVQAAERLAKAGYIHYEISNWARPGFECRHNLKYWTGVPYRGFGVSAHSFSTTHRYWNTVSLAEYSSMLDAGRLPIQGTEELTREMRLEEAFLIGLRRICGLDIWAVAADLDLQYPNAWFDRVCELEDNGWVQFDGKCLKLTPAGWLLANGITEELLWPNLLSI